MTETTAPGTEVATRANTWLTDLIESYRPDFTATVPEHISADAFVSLAAAYIRRDTKPNGLKQVARDNPGSIILALRECAALGHVPIKGTFALVPFKDKTAPGGVSCTGIEEVRGVIERMFRSGGVSSVHVQTVRANDWSASAGKGNGRARWNPSTMTMPDHEFDEYASPAERGDLIAVYAWAVMLDGRPSKVVWLNRAEVDRYRRVAKTQAFWSGDWEPEMWEKTALHRLEKYVPTSASYLRTAVAKEAVAANRFYGVADVPLRTGPLRDIEDAEILDETPSQTAGGPSQGRGADWSDVDTRQPPK